MAISLSNRAVLLRELGRREDALTTIGEAVTVDRRLADARPEPYLPDLTGSWGRCGPTWVRDLRDRCSAASTAFFFKQWGGIRPKSNGRELDGRTWDEMPAPGRSLVAA